MEQIIKPESPNVASYGSYFAISYGPRYIGTCQADQYLEFLIDRRESRGSTTKGGSDHLVFSFADASVKSDRLLMSAVQEGQCTLRYCPCSTCR